MSDNFSSVPSYGFADQLSLALFQGKKEHPNTTLQTQSTTGTYLIYESFPVDRPILKNNCNFTVKK